MVVDIGMLRAEGISSYQELSRHNLRGFSIEFLPDLLG
jgi:hypothetical protein